MWTYIGATALVVLCLACWFATAMVQGMTDEEREKWGHGPRGQGR
jgi:Spy/CpxP family protein refolding chaperone